MTLNMENKALTAPPDKAAHNRTIEHNATELPQTRISANGITERTISYHFNAGVSTISSLSN